MMIYPTLVATREWTHGPAILLMHLYVTMEEQRESAERIGSETE